MTGSAVEAGIRAYMRGDRGEAERQWREALAQDPGDDRARDYLAKLGASPATPPVPTRTPPPVATAPAASAWDEVPGRAPAIALAPSGGLELGSVHDGEPVDLQPAPLELDEPAVADGELAGTMQGARELFDLGDFSGSLELIERVLAADPRNAEALAYLKETEATLVAMYESRLGRLDAIPRLQVRQEEVLWLNLDHRAGFVLAQIDGTLTWDDLFALSGMPRLETARILARLVDDGVVRAG